MSSPFIFGTVARKTLLRYGVFSVSLMQLPGTKDSEWTAWLLELRLVNEHLEGRHRHEETEFLVKRSPQRRFQSKAMESFPQKNTRKIVTGVSRRILANHPKLNYWFNRRN
jgi:hypothetical protein